MCRYGLYGPYKAHFACFTCRKQFRRPIKPKSCLERCPQCGQAMNNMGLDFKPPQQQDVAAWQVVEQLYVHGIAFHSCGCTGPGYRPKRLREVAHYLATELPKSDGQRLLERLQPSTRSPKRRNRHSPTKSLWT